MRVDTSHLGFRPIQKMLPSTPVQHSFVESRAIPILEKAKRVCVLTVMKEKAIDTRRSGAELTKYLARHGVDVVLDEVDAKGRSIGDVFEAHVTYRNANLLVMGGYGHSRFREFILGGATNRILARPPVPTLLSH